MLRQVEARNRVTAALRQLGLDPLAPFWGLEAQPALTRLALGSQRARVLRTLILRSMPGAWGLRTPPLRRDCPRARRASLERALADVIPPLVAEIEWWNVAKYEPPRMDEAERAARRAVMSLVRGAEEDAVAVDAPREIGHQAVARTAHLHQAMASCARLPIRHPDFHLHRMALEHCFRVNCIWFAVEYVERERAERLQRSRQARATMTLEDELFGDD